MAAARTSFAAPLVLLALDLRGIANATSVAGVQRIEATVATGEATQVELLVDQQSRGVVRTAPFSFDWDTRTETLGLHTVLVRGTDARGTTTDKQVVLKVLPIAPPTSIAVPTPLVAQTSLVQPIASSPVASVRDQTGVAIAGLAGGLFAVLTGGGVWLVFRGSRRVPAPATVPPAPTSGDTLHLRSQSLGDQTMVSRRSPGSRVLRR